MGFGLSNNVLPFFPICHKLSPFSHSQHLKVSFLLPLSIFSWVFPFFSSLPFLFGQPIPLHSLYPLPFYPFYYIFSFAHPSSSSRFVRPFHSPFSYLGPYILLNIFLSKISRACSSFFLNVHASAPHGTAGLISVLYNIILVAVGRSYVKKSYNLNPSIYYWGVTLILVFKPLFRN